MTGARAWLRRAGVAAVLTFAWSVPAGAASWSPPVAVQPGDPTLPGMLPQDSRVAITDTGFGVAAYGGPTMDSFHLRVAERVPGGAWQGASLPLSTGPAYYFAVAIDPAGNALVVWDINGPTTQSIEVSTWHPGAAGWSPAMVVATTPTATIPGDSEDQAPSTDFSASSNASGQIVVAWQSVVKVFDPGYVYQRTVYGMVGTPTGGFSPPVPVSTLQTADGAPDMTTAIGPAGDAAIQWTRDYENSASATKVTDIEVAVGPAGVGFAPHAQSEVTDLTAPPRAEGGSVAVDAKGDVLSIFAVLPDPYHVESSYRPAGGTFGPLQQIAPLDEPWNTEQIKAAFDASGKATAAWIELAPPANEPSDAGILRSAARASGTFSTWGAATQVGDSFPNAGTVVSIAEADDGSAILGIDPGWSPYHSALFTRSGSGAFGIPEEPACTAFAITMAPDGDAVAACSGADDSGQIATRYLHDPIPTPLPTPPPTALPTPLPTSISTVYGPPAPLGSDAMTVAPPARVAQPTAVHTRTVAVGLRSVRVIHGRLVLHGTASGRGTVSITIRRRVRQKAIEVTHVTLGGGKWTRSLTLPSNLASGTYDIILAGAHMHGARTSVHLPQVA